ncbi:WD repeat-containing protein 17, partial [Nowakowskiella sp. JEL0078]
MDSHSWMFMKEAGHVETIFSCCFKEGDKNNVLATVSFDGSIKLWNLGTRLPPSVLNQTIHPPSKFDNFSTSQQTALPLTFLDGFPELDCGKVIPTFDASGAFSHKAMCSALGCLYSVSWSPRASDYLVVFGSLSGLVAIFDFAKRKLLREWRVHLKPIYNVRWCPLNQELIAAASEDGIWFVVFNLNLAKLRKIFSSSSIFSTDNVIPVKQFKHPSGVYGVDWCPFNENVLATGCGDSNVRIWSTCSEEKTILSGHSAKVFNVAFSPLLPNIIASGSDDNNVRIWNFQE